MCLLTIQALEKVNAEQSVLLKFFNFCVSFFRMFQMEKINLEDVQAFMLNLPKDELTSLMLSINYVPTLREVTAFLKSLNPGMVATLIENKYVFYRNISENISYKACLELRTRQ